MPQASDPVSSLAEALAAPPDSDRSPLHLLRRLDDAASREGWYYIALLCRAGLVEAGAMQRDDASWIDALVYNHRINDALLLARSRGKAEPASAPMRPLRLPARLLNFSGTDRWVAAADIEQALAAISKGASSVAPKRRMRWTVREISRVFSRLNKRLKDAGLMQLQRHAMAMGALTWRRFTRASRHEAIHVRIHYSTALLTLAVRVGDITRTVWRLLQYDVLPSFRHIHPGPKDNHFGVRGVSQRVHETLLAIRGGAPAPDILPHLQWFHRTLLGPLLAKPEVAAAIAALGEHPTLTIATHGALAQLPFAALHDGTRYLAERFNVVQSPPLYSAKAFQEGDLDWAAMDGGPPIPPAAPVRALIDPTLTHAAHEAAHLRRHFTERADILDSEANGIWDAATLRWLTAARGIGFLATHVQPSGLGTTGTTLQTPSERQVLFSDALTERVGADLVVLAGCVSSGQSDWFADDEDSLVSRYRQAGAASVISTLWPVSDLATPYYTDALMAGLAAGKSRAAAHGDALRSMLKAAPGIGRIAFGEERLIRQKQPSVEAVAVESGGTLDHPYFWGAFVLSGAWR